MAQITYTDKSTGDQFSAANANEIKDIVNDNDGTSILSFGYEADTSMDTSPDDGKVTWNNANQTNATKLYISFTNRDGLDLEAIVQEAIGIGDHLFLQEKIDASKFQRWEITATANMGDWAEVDVTLLAGTAQFGNQLQIQITSVLLASLSEPARVAVTGSGGKIWDETLLDWVPSETFSDSPLWLYDTSIVMADPGTGKVRGNNANLSLVTQIVASKTTDQGTNVADLLSIINQGALLASREYGEFSNYFIFTAGESVDNGTWFLINVTVSTASSFSGNGAMVTIGLVDNTGSTKGFIDYNDATGVISVLADTWTDLPNDGAGSSTNYNFKPNSVTELIDVSTGYLDLSDLKVGAELALRTQFVVNPDINNTLLSIRYVFGAGLFSFTITIGRLDDGSGKDYEQDQFLPFYIGADIVRTSPVQIQIKLSSAGTLTNSGSYISVK
ncbi:MAG: hypothetical protein COA36_16635 [Desulfotalea sp.]|nr:MAG: hypothetical protein COA36_16635 [Desulfotalea sp.]